MPCLHSVSASLYKKKPPHIQVNIYTLSPLKLAKVTAFGSLLDWAASVTGKWMFTLGGSGVELPHYQESTRPRFQKLC